MKLLNTQWYFNVLLFKEAQNIYLLRTEEGPKVVIFDVTLALTASFLLMLYFITVFASCHCYTWRTNCCAETGATHSFIKAIKTDFSWRKNSVKL